MEKAERAAKSIWDRNSLSELFRSVWLAKPRAAQWKWGEAG